MNFVTYHHRQQRRRRRRRQRRRLLFAFFTKVFDYILFFLLVQLVARCVCVSCRGPSEKLMLELEWKRSCAHILCRIAIPFFRASNAFVHMIDFNWFSSRTHIRTAYVRASTVHAHTSDTTIKLKTANEVQQIQRIERRECRPFLGSIIHSIRLSLFAVYYSPSKNVRTRRLGPIGVGLSVLFIPTSCLFFLAGSSAYEVRTAYTKRKVAVAQQQLTVEEEREKRRRRRKKTPFVVRL